MSIIVENIYANQIYDTVSEASTEGDDHVCLKSYRISSSNKNLAKNKVKSSLCRNFAEKGFCPYGAKCQFAHGIEELRCNVDENSYKTKPCNSYWKKGYCPYGFRCNFSHKVQPGELSEQAARPNLSAYR